MQRSKSQVLFRHLPGSVFAHEDGYIVQTHHVNGPRVSELNETLLLEELAEELSRWPSDRIGIPNPSTHPGEYLIREPEEVSWDVYPLTFECSRSNCRRITRWFRQDKLLADSNSNGHIRCPHCGGSLRQLRYLTAHNCGAMKPMHTPRCPNCGDVNNMYLEDLGSFRTSSWRCRQCGGTQGTRFVPCDCSEYTTASGQSYQLGYTVRDQRLWYPQSLTIISISGQTYDHLQRHPQRGVAAMASWLGDQPDISTSLSELDRSDGGPRLSEQEWTDQENRLQAANVDKSIIDEMRALRGPATTGVSAVMSSVAAETIELAGQRPFVERAGLFDRKIVGDRKSFTDVLSVAEGADSVVAQKTIATMCALGIEDISVTQKFPIVLASYGYTRVSREPGSSHLKSYATPKHYGGKTPIFAVPASTEALLVTFDARAVLGFLIDEKLHDEAVPKDLRTAQLTLADILAVDVHIGGDGAAGTVRRLVHSASHALLRALDDGRSGFGESSLAEWIVPDALTTAIYVASYKEFTLGALDTVLRRRLAPWLLSTAESVNHCDNDPMCAHVSSHKPHAACDRCLQLSFGCRSWNADLDRRLLRRFWLWTQQQTRSVA